MCTVRCQSQDFSFFVLSECCSSKGFYKDREVGKGRRSGALAGKERSADSITPAETNRQETPQGSLGAQLVRPGRTEPWAAMGGVINRRA